MARTTQDLSATQIFYSNNSSSNQRNTRVWNTQRLMGAGQLRGYVKRIELWMGGSEVYWPSAILYLGAKNVATGTVYQKSLVKQWGVNPSEVDYGNIPRGYYVIQSAVWISSSVYTGANSGTWWAYLNHEIG